MKHLPGFKSLCPAPACCQPKCACVFALLMSNEKQVSYTGILKCSNMVEHVGVNTIKHDESAQLIVY